MPRRIAAQSLSQAEVDAQISAIRQAWLGTDASGEYLITEVSLDPPQLIVVDGATGAYYSVSVTVSSSGQISFGVPLKTSYTPPSTASAGTVLVDQQAPRDLQRRAAAAAPQDSRTAGRGRTARFAMEIAAAVARRAISAKTAEQFYARAERGEDMSWVSQLAASPLRSSADAEYERLFGPKELRISTRPMRPADVPAVRASGGAEYDRLFGPPPAEDKPGRTTGRTAAARPPAGDEDAAAYEALFGKGQK